LAPTRPSSAWSTTSSFAPSPYELPGDLVLFRTIDGPRGRPSRAGENNGSHRYWESRFGSDPKVLGKIIQINRVPVALIGVAPPGFAGAMQIGESADITAPLAHHGRFQPDRAANRAQPWYWWVRIMGRLAPRATAAQARASLEPIFQQAARDGWPEMPSLPTLAADPGGQGENDRRRQYAQSPRILMGLVSLVLLAACATVANLLLARGSSRRQEIAVRLALGADRAHIISQLLAESVVLASLGGALGVLVAYASRGLLVALRQFGSAPAVLELPLDLRVLSFTIAVATGTALLCGLAPAIRATHVDLTRELQRRHPSARQRRTLTPRALRLFRIGDADARVRRPVRPDVGSGAVPDG
jgi:FtsX-like permease family